MAEIVPDLPVAKPDPGWEVDASSWGRKQNANISELADGHNDHDERLADLEAGGGGGGVPETRTVNGKSLDQDVVLVASDVGAATTTHTHAQADVSGLSASLGAIGSSIGGLSSRVTDLENAPDPEPLPPGGVTGQVLSKASALDHDVEWIDPPEGGGGGPITADQITDSTSTGRTVLTSSDAAAARAAIGAGTSNLALGTTGSTAKAGDYQPTAANISDATATGRSVLTATNAAAARSTLGAGTSNLQIGTTGTTAKAGDYTPGWPEVTGKPATFAPSAHDHPAAQISDSTTTGRALLAATDASAARTAIGAGTSSLTIGTTSTTAKAGDYAPTWTEVQGKPSTFAPSTHTHTASQVTDLSATISASLGQIAVVTTAATARTLELGDVGKSISSTASTAVTITVPTDAAVAIPLGSVVQVAQTGTGQVTIAPASGVTLRYAASLTTRARYSILTLHKIAANEWLIGGDAT